MIRDFEVGAVFRIINEASPALAQILRQIRELNAAVDKARANLSTMSKFAAPVGLTAATRRPATSPRHGATSPGTRRPWSRPWSPASARSKPPACRALETKEKRIMMDTHAIASEVGAAILAACAPGITPPFELTLRCFTDAYERFDGLPSEDQHREISAIVGALIRTR